MRGRQAALVLAVVLGLLCAHVADVARRGLFSPPVPGPGRLLPWIVVGFFLALAAWTLPDLWQGRRRGFTRGRLVGTIAALAGLGHFLPLRTGMAAELHQAFWAAGPDWKTDLNLLSISGLGIVLTVQCAVARGRGARRRRGAAGGPLAGLTYAAALFLWASPAVQAWFGAGWTLFPPWPDPPLGVLAAATLAAMAVAEGIYLVRPWALAGVFMLNIALAAGLILFVLQGEEIRLVPLRLVAHLLALHWLRNPRLARRYGAGWLGYDRPDEPKPPTGLTPAQRATLFRDD